MNYLNGAKKGFTIALGYFPVAFAYGVIAIESGLPVWFPILTSITNYTGTGQFVGTELVAIGVSFLELFTTMLIINIRYTLMSLSLSQKMTLKFSTWQRLIIAFGVTDENYAVAISQKEELTMPFLVGLMTTAYMGWVGGTICGAFLGNIFPKSLMSAFGIALYSMFVAIIIPATRGNKNVLFAVGISVIGGCLFYYIPFLKSLGDGWGIIIPAVICALIMSFIRPIKDDENIDSNNGAKTNDTIVTDEIVATSNELKANNNE